MKEVRDKTELPKAPIAFIEMDTKKLRWYLSLLKFVYGRFCNRSDINANAITTNKVTYILPD